MKHMQRKEQATSAERLKRIARKVWKGILSEYLNKIYKSMPRRMQAVIDAEGSHTKYKEWYSSFLCNEIVTKRPLHKKFP